MSPKEPLSEGMPLPCPFCCKPGTCYDSDGWGWSVECFNKECDLAPVTGCFPSEAEALLKWNTRHQSPAAVEGECWLTREQIEAYRKNTETEPGNFLYRLCDMALLALKGK